jgi:hypothetical protein
VLRIQRHLTVDRQARRLAKRELQASRSGESGRLVRIGLLNMLKAQKREMNCCCCGRNIRMRLETIYMMKVGHEVLCAGIVAAASAAAADGIAEEAGHLMLCGSCSLHDERA